MPAESTHDRHPSEASPSDGGLRSRSFVGLLVTQFLGAVNDNMFRWLVVPIGKEIVGEDQVAMVLSLGMACFVVPYLLLAAPAGFLADRFSKRTVIVGCKVAEVVIMVLGVCAILAGQFYPGVALYPMLAVVALMGAQSALFSPSKFGCIPEIVHPERVTTANGLIGMTTVLAIVVGTIAGNGLFDLTRSLGSVGTWTAAFALVGVAAAGLIASLSIAPLRAADPTRKFPFNAPVQTCRDLALLASRRPLVRAALGIAVFWSLGALAQLNIDLFATTELAVDQQTYVGILLAVLAIGVGVGSVLAGLWSSGKVELGLVPLGAVGIAVSAMLLFAVPEPTGAGGISGAYLWSCVWLFALGVGAGMYNIPLIAFLQRHAPQEVRGRILAASNFMNFFGMGLAAGVFWLCRDGLGLLHEGWRFSSAAIFGLLGVATVPVLFYILWLLPGTTVRFLVWLLSHTIYRVRLEGRENLPKQGGALIVANHVSFIDGVLLLLFFPRPIRIIARADTAHRAWFRWLAKDLGIIFITPGKRSMVKSIRIARDALRAGQAVCVFPEGRITRSGELGEFHRGFLAILKDTDVPVVPIFLAGLWGSIFSYEGGRLLWKRPRRWPFPVSILMGQPICEPTDTDQVRQAVMQLQRQWERKQEIGYH